MYTHSIVSCNILVNLSLFSHILHVLWETLARIKFGELAMKNELANY